MIQYLEYEGIRYANHADRPLSKSALVIAGRAARKIAKEVIEQSWEVVDSTVGPDEPSEALLESSCDEARDRNVYQSEYEYERWMTWRSLVESWVIHLVTSKESK